MRRIRWRGATGQPALTKAVEDEALDNKGRKVKADRDVILLGIVTASIILFVGTGGSVLRQVIQSWLGLGQPPDAALTCAVLLNIALLIFGWRRYVELQQEVAERRRAEQRARMLAEVDALTNCLNRRSGGPAVDRLIEDAARMGRDVCIFMIDLDNFKHINDVYGHQAGDAVLSTVARRMNGVLPAGSVLARIGGDEFVGAVMHDKGRHDFVEEVALRLVEAIAEPIYQDGAKLDATVSLGIASTDQGAISPGKAQRQDAHALIHRADIAMYHAKKTGRDRHCWFDVQMEDELLFRHELETAIRAGIPAGEFVPYYEQQIDLMTGELTGFEMLARWDSPRFGLVGPEVFIPVAEEIDLISDLSETLIRQALADAREWHPDLTLSVNISPLQLRDNWFAQKLLHLLVESGFPSARLEIEITESCLHENLTAVRTIITSLRNQGIRVSLDDFGTGYSSLAQLRSLTFDRLKIDRSFVTEMLRDGNCGELVRAIISLGRGLGMPVTAEGIEDPEVLGALQEFGHMKGQGYLYGMPEDAETTRQRLVALGLISDEAQQSNDMPSADVLMAERLANLRQSIA
jgi:diguanylate cyclase (GGDEF)-like protein